MKDFHPISALMIYTGEKQGSYYIEAHEVENGTFKAGRPLSMDGIERLVKAFSHLEKPTGIFQERTLSMSGTKLLWWVPAEKRHLIFSKHLNISNGKVNCPPMLFFHGRDLFVFALKENERPTVETKLFHAPFHNVSHDGNVCLGSARQPKTSLVSNRITGYESAFFQSKFSETHYNPMAEGANLNLVLKDLIETGKEFPLDLLVDTKITLGDFMRKEKLL